MLVEHPRQRRALLSPRGWSARRSRDRRPRTLAISKLLDETFKPKFIDRSLGFNRPSAWTRDSHVHVNAPSQRDESLVNAEGTIGTMTASGDVTKVVFRGEEFERCIAYANDAAKTCLKRGKVYDSVGEGNAPTKFLTGAKPGLSVAIKFGFPRSCGTGRPRS